MCDPVHTPTLFADLLRGIKDAPSWIVRARLAAVASWLNVDSLRTASSIIAAVMDAIEAERYSMSRVAGVACLESIAQRLPALGDTDPGGPSASSLASLLLPPLLALLPPPPATLRLAALSALRALPGSLLDGDQLARLAAALAGVLSSACMMAGLDA
jgi:hypothetical protein